jgi:hypothetical protein
VLPQRQLQKSVVSYLRTVAGCLPGGFGRLPVWQRTKLALTPSQGRVYLQAMAGPTFPPDESHRLEEYLLTLQQLVGEISLTVGRFLPACPPSLAAELTPQVETLRELMKSGLNELADAFAAARPPADHSSKIHNALVQWDQVINLLRTRLREQDADAATGVTLMGLASRYRTGLVLLTRAYNEARALKLSDYLGDVAL